MSACVGAWRNSRAPIKYQRLRGTRTGEGTPLSACGACSAVERLTGRMGVRIPRALTSQSQVAPPSGPEAAQATKDRGRGLLAHDVAVRFAQRRTASWT